MNRGGEHQRKNHGTEQAANHGNRQRLQHLRSSPKGESQRQHSRNRRHRRHGDGPQAPPSRLDHRLFRGLSQVAKSLFGVQQQNAVFSHDADHHDDAHERRDVESRVRDQ